MKSVYRIKKANALSSFEIRTILRSWEVGEWQNMGADTFRSKFINSEFHILADTAGRVICMARINFEFKIEIKEKIYPLAELAGLAAVEKRKGYGTQLILLMKENLHSRGLETVGFCEKNNRVFYEKTGFRIFYNHVKYLREFENNEWIIPADDTDIIDVCLSTEMVALIESLTDENPGRLFF